VENDSTRAGHVPESAQGAKHPAGARSLVAATAVRLYATNGFEATSVEQIAHAAGLSRSTFFRQFRSKEDVVFADHDELVDQTEAFLNRGHKDPWLAVCEAAALVFEHYAQQGELARQRYAVVNAIPALRNKELVTVFRYERLFNSYLNRTLPGLAALDGIRFASAVVSTNNYFLRALMRGDEGPPAATDLWAELNKVRRLYGVLPNVPGSADDVVVAVFPRSTPGVEIAREIQRRLQHE
jgi:AcrR family transcriptional regulator